MGDEGGKEKQTTAFKAMKGGELRETTADTVEGSNDDDGMTEDLTRRLAEKGGRKGDEDLESPKMKSPQN